eukprot:13877505-Alexandrium_andersonii.AAC.1
MARPRGLSGKAPGQKSACSRPGCRSPGPVLELRALAPAVRQRPRHRCPARLAPVDPRTPKPALAARSASLRFFAGNPFRVPDRPGRG